ncbi:hypothetical protein [Limnoglobus roseus]|uniref:Glycine zipper domain-containing protein n=1 Tax=Limnoglobus roseus TaxID=2598579 RepID=A0A5C1A9K3_9BACT|nr:hypothetical protein [Limnoglobus roseus]QEL15881.1 hypothetical protein PX52LOC_02817 [Limnoglobus roseus]
MADAPDTKLADVLHRLDEVVAAVASYRPPPPTPGQGGPTRRPDPARGVELDADKVARRGGGTGGGGGEPTGGQWDRVGDLIGRAAAAAVARALSGVRDSGAGAAKGAGAPQNAALLSRLADTRAGRAVVELAGSKLGRGAKAAAGKVVGTKVGRGVKAVAGKVVASKAGRVARAAGAKFVESKLGRKAKAVTAAAAWVVGAVRHVGGPGGGESRAARAGSASGKVAGHVIGSTVGAAVGAVVGGPVGARVGAAVGGQAGEHVGGEAAKVAGKIHEFGKRAEEASKKLHDVNQRLGGMSGLLNQVQTEGDIRDQLRSRQKGDRISSSARTLMESDQANKDNQREQDIILARIDNYFQSIENYLSTMANWPVEKIAKQLNKLFPGDDAQSMTLAESFSKAAKEFDEEQQRARERMKNGPG